MLLVGLDDAGHQRVTHHVAGLEAVEGDALDVLQHALGLHQTALAGRGQVDLGDVAGDDRLGAEADAGEEHLHLLGRGVLGLVQDDEGVGQRAAAHVGQRSDLDLLALDELADALGAHQLVEGVEERAQIGVDLLGEVTRQEAQALAGFHGGAGEDDALDLVTVQGIDGAGHRQEGLAGTGRADAEGEVVPEDVLQVLALVGGAPLQLAAPGAEGGIVGRLRRQRFGDGRVCRIVVAGLDDGQLDVLRAERVAVGVVEAAEQAGGTGGLLPLAAEGEMAAAAADAHVQGGLDEAQVRVEGAAQAGQPLVVGFVDGEVGLGRHAAGK